MKAEKTKTWLEMFRDARRLDQHPLNWQFTHWYNHGFFRFVQIACYRLWKRCNRGKVGG